MVDWEKLHREWDKVPAGHKKKIADLFRAKTKEKLAELFRKEPMAAYVYEEAVGERWIPVPPPPPPPPPAPPVAPPPVAVPPPVERGLQKADEKRLRVRFEARLAENTVRIERRWTSMFEDRLYEWRDAFKGLPREEAVRRAFDEVERLVETILPLVKPPRVPEVRPPEVPPVAPPLVVLPPVAPPPGVMRRWGMPFSTFLCPAHLGEGVEYPVLRSPYLEDRLRRLRLPTTDPLFFELCDEHRQKYGGAFELFPRYVVEFWVGEALAKAEIDIATMVGMGISEDYCLYSLKFYQEHKKEAVQ